MRNTAEYEAYLTNPLEDRYPEEPTPTCDECGEPHDEQPWCGECGCCRACCKNEYVDCMPESKQPMTLTVYLHVDENENPDKWNIGEMFDDVNVLAWKWQDGHHSVQPMNRHELIDNFINAYGKDNEAALHYAYDLIVNESN